MSAALLKMIMNLILEMLAKKLGSGAVMAAEGIPDQEVEAIRVKLPAPLMAPGGEIKETLTIDSLELAVNAVFDYLDTTLGGKSILASYFLKMARGAVLSGLAGLLADLKARLP